MVPEIAAESGRTAAQNLNGFGGEVDPGFSGAPYVPGRDPVLQEPGAESISGASWIDRRQCLDFKREDVPSLPDGHSLTALRHNCHIELLVKDGYCGPRVISAREQFSIFQTGKYDISSGKRSAGAIDTHILDEANGSGGYAHKDPSRPAAIDERPNPCIPICVEKNVTREVDQTRALQQPRRNIIGRKVGVSPSVGEHVSAFVLDDNDNSARL